MKKTLFAIAAGTLLAGSAYAQSSVTLYGIADVSVRYTNNTNTSKDSLIQLTDGAVTQSRWGLKGAEDLGGGLKGIFQLENGFSLDTGRQNDSSRLFNRQAYVGLQGTFGAVTLGRQYSLVHDFLGDFDPLTIGNYAENAFYAGTQYTLRYDNALKYKGKFGGLSANAIYSFGEVAGENKRGRAFGGGLQYAAGPFGIGAVYQQENANDAAAAKRRSWTAGANYSFGIAKVFFTYLNNKDDRINRKDNTYSLGVTANVTPALALTGAAYYDDMKLAGNKGKHYTGVLLAEYSLSKRTQVYGTVDYTKVKDAALVDLNDTAATDNKSRVGVGAGIRHIF